jgi:hypothetical protein
MMPFLLDCAPLGMPNRHFVSHHNIIVTNAELQASAWEMRQPGLDERLGFFTAVEPSKERVYLYLARILTVSVDRRVNPTALRVKSLPKKARCISR